MTLAASIWRRSRRWLALAALAALAVGAAHGSVGAESHRPCSEAAIEELRLPVMARVDEVRIDVARHSPQSGAATVRVDAGRFARQVRVYGSQSKGLKFSPALTGRRFEVSLDPAFDARDSACVERITLLSNGKPVATVRP